EVGDPVAGPYAVPGQTSGDRVDLGRQLPIGEGSIALPQRRRGRADAGPARPPAADPEVAHAPTVLVLDEYVAGQRDGVHDALDDAVDPLGLARSSSADGG